MLNLFNELISQTIVYKRRNIFQNPHKTCPLTEVVSIARQCRAPPIIHDTHSDAQHPNLSWSEDVCLGQSGHTNALWARLLLVCIRQTDSREATLGSRIEVKLWIDDTLNVFTGQGGRARTIIPCHTHQYKYLKCYFSLQHGIVLVPRHCG